MRTPLLIVLTAAVVVAMTAAAASAAPKPLVDIRATIRGEVLADGLAKPGDDVNEGDALVYVKTQTGRAAAARAPVDGRVAEVLVKPGSVIRELGAVVMRLDPK